MGRRKGFPVQLPKTHWLTVQQIHAWLRAEGATTPEMDEVAALIPRIILPTIDKAERAHWFFGYAGEVKGNKTIRVYAEHVLGMINLLRLVANYCPHGQIPVTIFSRVDKLEKINELDLLADAGR